MHIAVEGCCHGKLEDIYECLAQIEKRKKIKIDLLLILGDFQAIRNSFELSLMKCPEKYREMGSFYKYYTGLKTAPVTTIFIGGNHESSLYLHEIYHGGWVAPNIYFLGYAGVVNFNGLRIGGLSGIYNRINYKKGHFETPPFDKEVENVSVYHTREFDVLRMKQISSKLHILMTHDWPRGIAGCGNIKKLLQIKPFFEKEIHSNTLGSLGGETLMKNLKPSYHLSAHLHIKYPAQYYHGNGEVTRFLSLGKCVDRADFLQVLSFPNITKTSEKLFYDPEWLSIITKTMKHFPLTEFALSDEIHTKFQKKEFRTSQEELDSVIETFGSLEIPQNFEITSPPFNTINKKPKNFVLEYKQNPQTKKLLSQLGVEDVFLKKSQKSNSDTKEKKSEMDTSERDESKDSENPDLKKPAQKIEKKRRQRPSAKPPYYSTEAQLEILEMILGGNSK